VHLICQTCCLFGVLKRGALSHSAVWKLRIAVNLFTPVVEALTASESVNSLHSTKARWFGEFAMARKGCGWSECLRQGRLVRVLNTSGLFENAQGYSPRKTCPSLFRFVVKYRSVEADAGISRGSHFVTESP